METLITILLALGTLTFLISVTMYFTGSRHFNRTVLRYSTVIMLIAIGLLVLALWLNGTIFKTHTNILIG